MATDGWHIVYEGFAPEQERLRESLCTLGNGKFATRGAAEEFAASNMHYPGTYFAGGYNRLDSEIAGETVSNEDLVNFTNWLPLSFKPVDGDWVGENHEILAWRQVLHMDSGMLERSVRWRDGAQRETEICSRRLVSIEQPQYAAIEYTVTPLNWNGNMMIRAWLDGGVTNSGVARYRQLNAKHLAVSRRGQVAPEGVYLVVQTSQSRLEVATASRTRLFSEGVRLDLRPACFQDEYQIGEEFQVPAKQGQAVRVEKVVAMYSTRDRGITEPGLDARLAILRAPDFPALERTQTLAWNELWRTADIVLAPNGEKVPEEEDQRILRLHIFHLLQTISRHSSMLDVGVPARGLHGEAYRGHVFWDELFVHPFYTYRAPEVSRSLLLYRYHRLEAARALAKESGFRGAMYPWQSSSDGREQTQTLHLNPLSGKWVPDYSSLQRHINAVIVHDIWFYFHATRDHEFMERYGARMILEIAKFWSSLATWNDETQRYEIHGVMGPDEYHERYPDTTDGGLRNNAYTNVMAVWCLDRALETLESVYPERRRFLTDILEIDRDEIARWCHIAARMTVPFHDGVISQFEGYERLPEFDWEGYRKKYGNIERLDRILKAEGDSPDKYKVSKQADACMLFYMLAPKTLSTIFHRLGYPFDETTVGRNIEYYLPRTSHGSTLSKVVFASLLDRIDRKHGYALFHEALRSDIDDLQRGTTPEGIHLGAMAGTVNIVLTHYAGVDTSGDVIEFSPRLPSGLAGLHFQIRFRERWLELRIAGNTFHLRIADTRPEPVQVKVNGNLAELFAGEWREFLAPKA
jgi:alpha,alpha-trehalase